MKSSRLVILLGVVLCLINVFDTVSAGIIPAFAQNTDLYASGSRTLIVGANQEFNTINSAIAVVSDGDTIFVKNGIYDENLYFSKENITIEGEDSSKTIIKPSDMNSIGVKIVSSNNIKLSNISICSVMTGVSIEYSSDLEIKNCKLYNNYESGVKIDTDSNNVSISGCDIYSNSNGITNYSSSNIITGCKIHENESGIRYYEGLSSSIKDNEIYLNTKEGIYIECKDFSCENNLIMQNETGILISSARAKNYSRCGVLNNRLYYNLIGINIDGSSNLLIDGNQIGTYNDETGIDSYGIYHRYGYDNIITNNRISNLFCGIFVDSFTSYETIYNNDLISNKIQAKDLGDYNYWFYDMKGNYWSDLKGEDSNSDGIVDTSYNIIGSAECIDYYPFAKQISTFSDVLPTPRSKTIVSETPAQNTNTPTSTETETPKATATAIDTATPTTSAPINTATSTATSTPTNTATPTTKSTATSIPTNTMSPTVTATAINTPTPTAAQTSTNTVTPTTTTNQTYTVTPTVTLTATNSDTPTPTSSGKTIYVGEGQQYTTISSAVSAALAGDTIVIKNGKYNEGVVIDKNNITLEGEGSEVVIDRGIKKSSDLGPFEDKTGILVTNAHGVNIKNITVQFCKAGITIKNSKDINLEYCKITGILSDGIWLDHSDNANISGCDIFSANNGIYVYFSNCVLTKNKVHNNTYGVYIFYSNSNNAINIITENEIYKNSTGCYLHSSNFNLEKNKIDQNTDGVYLYQIKIDYTIKTIKNNVISSSVEAGIYCYECVGISIYQNEIYTDQAQVALTNYGILDKHSSILEIFTNKISRCNAGIQIDNGYYVGNSGSYKGSDDRIYQNYFIDNIIQAVDNGLNNSWDYQYRGNYWSDYTVKDNDGVIGVTPYDINAGKTKNSDHYPLISMQSGNAIPSLLPMVTPTPTNLPTETPTNTPVVTYTNTSTVTPTTSKDIAIITPTPTASTIQAASAPVIYQPQNPMPGYNLIQASQTPTATPTSVVSSSQTPTATQLNKPTPTPVATYAINFKDIDSHWGKQYIEFVASMGIMKGKSSTMFCPDDSITRAECATVLVTFLNKIKEDHTSSYFSDIGPNDWYYNYIMSALDIGIMSGYPDKTFKPIKPITRQEIVIPIAHLLTDFYGFAKINALTNDGNSSKDDSDLQNTLVIPFKDVSQIQNYALDSVATVVNYGLVVGKDNSFEPASKTTRAELAVIIYKLINKYGMSD